MMRTKGIIASPSKWFTRILSFNPYDISMGWVTLLLTCFIKEGTEAWGGWEGGIGAQAPSLQSSHLSVTPSPPSEAGTHMVVATLGPGHHQAWVQHVPLLLGTTVDMRAPAPDLPPVQDDGGVDGYRVGLQRPGLRTLTLDLPTLGISEPEREKERGREGRRWN